MLTFLILTIHGLPVNLVVMVNQQTQRTAEAHVYALVGQAIKEKRELAGLTQEGLAQRVSLTRTSITNIEKGRQRILVHTLFQIAEALLIEPSALLPQSSGEKPSTLADKIRRLPVKERERKWILDTTSSKEEG